MQTPDYARFTKALASAGTQPARAFDALCALTREHVGVKLFTIMTCDNKRGFAQRVYSNMPDAYPVSGTKPVNRTHWSEEVIEKRRTFVANDIDAIAQVFDDHGLIRSLGCQSVINVPVEIGGEVIGTVNCLHEAGFYTPDRIAAAEALKLPAAACLLLNERSAREGTY
jgi:GAF domain-containing protein